MQQLWNTTIPQIETKEHAEICYRAKVKVKDTYDFMGAGMEYMEKIAEPQCMWFSNFFQAAQAQHFFYF